MPKNAPKNRPDQPEGRLEFIQTEASFEDFLDAIEHEPVLGVDTEANSMHAYREELCLIQVSSSTRDFLLDPMAGLDLDPLLDILEDPKIVKVFHDAEFDLFLLGRAYDLRMQGLFDTKVASLALGHAQIGLAAVVDHYFGVQLDKSQQRSDWGRRPLATAQLEYAWKDTHYLLPLRDLLLEEIHEADPLVDLEVDSECRRLEKMVTSKPKDQDVWLKVKGARKLHPRALRYFRDLYDWREKEAERRNLPLFKILANPVLIGMATAAPLGKKELDRFLSRGQFDRYATALYKVLLQSAEKEDLVLPKVAPLKGAERTAADQAKQRIDALKQWRKKMANQRPTDPSLVLNREVLEKLADLGPETLQALEATDLLEPWRLDHYGEGIVSALR
jgi:ribonuclease D